MFQDNESTVGNVSFHQKRTDFMNDIRRKARFRIINQKRSAPGDLKHGDLNLSHVSNHPQREKLVPLLKQYLDLTPTLDDLTGVRKMVQAPADM